MRILYSCPLDPTKFKSPGQHVASIVSELAIRGHLVALIHPGEPLAGIGASTQYPLRIKRKRLLGRLLADFQYALALIKNIRENQYDVVYHRLEKWSVLPLLVFKTYRIPVVLEINADVRAELDSLNASVLNRRMYPLSENLQVMLSTKIVVVSEGIGKNLTKNIPSCSDKVVVVENGADTAVYYPRDRNHACMTLGLDPTQKYVTFSGSFQPWQGLETLLSSAHEVQRSVPDVKFIVIGDGKLRSLVERQIEEHGLKLLFQLTGWLEPQEVALYLAASDVCVAPYSTLAALDPSVADEQFSTALMKCSPLKMYTYMAMGKPVVASGFKDGGQKIKEWESGLAFKPGCAEDLANSLITLLTDPVLADLCGANAAERTELHHTWAVVAQKIDESCLQLLH